MADGARELQAADYSAELINASRMWRARLSRRLREIGADQTRWSALRWVATTPETSLSDLAAGLGIDQPAALKAVDALEERGFVQRARHTRDRRVKALRCTPEGLAALEAMDRVVAVTWAETFSGVSDPEVLATLRLLGRLTGRRW